MIRYACLLALVIPLTTLGDERPVPPVPTGHDLYTLRPSEFQAYVGGIHDGQAALVNAISIQPVVCLDARMTRHDLAILVLHALPKLPAKVMDLPANDVVFRVLLQKAPCPHVTWRLRE